MNAYIKLAVDLGAAVAAPQQLPPGSPLMRANVARQAPGLFTPGPGATPRQHATSTLAAMNKVKQTGQLTAQDYQQLGLGQQAPISQPPFVPTNRPSPSMPGFQR